MPGSLRGAEKTAGEGLRIEAASVERLAEIQAMTAALGEGPRWPPDAWRRFVQPPSGDGLGGLLLLAWGKTGDLWGWLAASRVWERSDLEYVLVHPARRGRGVAGRLVGDWIAWAHTQGVTDALLEVRASNESALRLYRAWGFGEQGRRPNYYERPQEDAVLMGRTL